MRTNPAFLTGVIAASMALAVSACDDASKPKNPFEPAPKATREPPKVTEPPKPSGPPALRVDSGGAKVGFTTIPLEKSDGADKLLKELRNNESDFTGKDVDVTAERKSKPEWVRAMIDALGNIGAESVVIKTDTREEFPQKLAFVPESKVKSPAPCSVVAMIIEDRSAAVWKLAGGTAIKRPKGLAGADLTTTAETLERAARSCPQSTVLFVSSAPGIEWGLVYDLACAGKKLEKVHFDHAVLLEKAPTAGRPVELAH